MMKRLVLAIFFGWAILPCAGRATGAAGTVAAPYLKMPMGARSEGMGEAFTGLADDTSAMFYNPGGMSQLSATNISFMQMLGFGGVNYSYAGMITPAENLGMDVWGTVGLFYELVSIDNILRTKELPDGSYDQAYADQGYTYTSGGTVVGISYAWQATKMFSLGATTKFINEKVDTYNGWGFGVDLSLFSKPKVLPGLSAGLTFQNLGQSPGSAPLPTALRVGAAYGIDNLFSLASYQVDLLNFSVDTVLPVVPIDGSVKGNFGVEYKKYFGSQTAAIRTGYRYPVDLGYLAGVTAGMSYGLELDGMALALHYAWVPYGDLGMAHRLEVSAEFAPKPKPQPTPEIQLKTPQGVQATAGDSVGQVSWKANLEPVSGYNVYLSYKPTGPWFRLNSKPVTSTLQRLALYNHVTAYIAVTALSPKIPYKESPRSTVVSVTPRPAGGGPPPGQPAAVSGTAN